MQLIVKLTPAAAKRMRTTRGGAAAGGVWKSIRRPMIPLHPTTRDGSLESFFVIEVDDAAEGSHLAEKLLKDPAVEAAYVKPADAPP